VLIGVSLAVVFFGICSLTAFVAIMIGGKRS
jgi:hypothetical protein